jgi:hypothetical protein
VQVLLNAEPPEAHLVVDDVPLGSNPYIKKFPRDGAKHTVRAEAPGYTPELQELVADINKTVNIQLKPVARSAGAATAPATYHPPPRAAQGGGRKQGQEPAAAAAAPPPTPSARAPRGHDEGWARAEDRHRQPLRQEVSR